jgi:hypothetical protein
MKVGVCVVMSVAVVACSSSGSSGASDAGAAGETGPGGGVDTSPADDGGDASSSSDAPAANVGNCAVCTLNKCKPEFNGCGGDSACVNALYTFNNCYQQTRDGKSCGATFAKQNAAAAALWGCLDRSCSSVCE